MIAPLLILFIVVPIAELAVIIQVGELIGVWWTIALLIADSILGTLLMRAQGRAAWARFTTAMQAGRVPAREVVDGALVILGGAFLLTPGFITDIFGLALLLPPSRAVIRGLLVRRLGRRMVVSMTTPRQPPHGPRPPAADVEGTAVEIDEDGRR